MKLLFALPGFHRFDRGAEVALLSVARELARMGEDVTVIGSGSARAGEPYAFQHVASVRRETFERFPKLPLFRSETAWEDATFAVASVWQVPVADYDATITCSFPFTHWAVRRGGVTAPTHVFVTQNGDWPAVSDSAEFRFFACDTLVCTNPDYFARNRDRWRCALIPNGVDLDRFAPGRGARETFGLPESKPIILMVSAFIDSKRVLDGIRAVAQLEQAHLVIAGDGPLRDEATELANRVLPGRYTRLSVPAEQMPELYRSADAFLHLSLLESFGNVFLEAWASGLPIVAHDSERLRWILGHSPFLCDTQDQAVLTERLRAALATKQAEMRKGIERFAWSAIAAQYRDAIAEAVAAKSAAKR